MREIENIENYRDIEKKSNFVAYCTMETVDFIEIVTFKREIVPKEIWDIIPNNTKYEHWGIFVHFTDGKTSLYHADKKDLRMNTKWKSKEWTKESKNDQVDIILLIGYVSQGTNSLVKSKLDEYCNNISENRI